MKRFTSPGHAQWFLSAFSDVSPTSGSAATGSAPMSTAGK
jgi:hypothetical protein